VKGKRPDFLGTRGEGEKEKAPEEKLKGKTSARPYC